MPVASAREFGLWAEIVGCSYIVISASLVWPEKKKRKKKRRKN
jgi:hypothetical protein